MQQFISTECLGQEADCSRLQASTADVCYAREGSSPQVPVDAIFQNSICSQKPSSSSQGYCSHPQGMLQGLKGTKGVDSLYTFEVPQQRFSQTGIFSNPLVIAGKSEGAGVGSSSLGVLRGSPQEIAGNYLVFSVRGDTAESARMHVHDVPLMHYQVCSV